MVTAISGNHHRIDFMIGPGKALDPDKYFIICTDAIANGFSTSPSNSKMQPRMQFPKFTIRDMVESQYRLLREKFGIDHVVAVIGPSMGGMQVLQWGVSHPDFMDSLVAMVPLAKTPAWSVAVMEASRKAIMTDAAWNNGNYESPPEQGVRLWRDIRDDDVHFFLKQRDDVWELTVVTLDKPFLFSNICGVLAYFGMNILRGYALTSLSSLVLDVFQFQDKEGF